MYVNGQYSEWFDARTGTRQGDPLSPYLFHICAEMLSSVIHQNKNIHGIKILDEEILLSQFSDDKNTILDGKKGSLCSCVHTLQCFASMSGLMINIGKTVAVSIGSRRNSQVKFMPELGLTWNPATFKVLGVICSQPTCMK